MKRWGIRKTDKWELCKNRSDLEHILKWCPVALKQKRFTWRHDSILNHITKALKKHMQEQFQIYIDIPGHKINSGTIPQDVLITESRPDIVFIDRKSKLIYLWVLTCSFEKNIDSAHLRKNNKYFGPKKDLLEAGWTTHLIPFEVRSRGKISRKNNETLKNTIKLVNNYTQHKKLVTELSQISLLASFSIFQACCQPSWESPPFLSP